MDLLELECPNCLELLELDVGFAGGVCRCSNCSILMTVPENPEAERAEKLIRPDVPMGSSSFLEDQLPTPSPDEEPVDFTKPVEFEEPESQTYTTESGKQIQIDSDTVIPTAQKKKRPVVRATVVLVFVLLVGGIVGACLFALAVLVSEDDDAGAWQPDREVLTQYDQSANPFLISLPNVLGLPVTNKTAVVVDTSSSGRQWLGLVKDALLAGSDFDRPGMQIQIIYGTQSGAEAHPDQPSALSELDRSRLKSFLRGALAMGEADLAQAVKLAVGGSPSQIILITGRDLPDLKVADIRVQLEGQSAIRFDVIGVDITAATSLGDLTRDHSGQCVLLTTQRLTDWYNETF